MLTGKNSTFQIDVTEYPVHMKEIISTILREQEKIGWDHAIHGLLSKAWADLASVSFESNQISNNGGVNRIRRCLSALFNFSMGLWKTRNSALHDVNNKANQHQYLNMSDQIAYLLYKQHDKICFDDRYLCQLPLADLLKSSSMSTQRQWITRMKQVKKYTHKWANDRR